MSRVLVIEDSPTQAEDLLFILEEAGFSADSAPDAEQGFARLASGRFDAVLSDLHLPGDDGFELCRRIKADPKLCQVPVVVCTSEADPLNVLRGLEAGADDFITKGRDPEEFVARLRRVFARPAAGGSSKALPVAFLGHEFAIRSRRAQLLAVLVSAFEDVVQLNEKYQAGEAAQRELNRELADRNLRLQMLADSEHQAHEERKQAESQLIQAEKLSALGQMVAGVAHEINNPLAFVINNLAVLRRDVGPLLAVLGAYRDAEAAPPERLHELLEDVRRRADDVDLSYTLDSLDGLMARAEDGLRRIQRIVSNLRDFVRLDESELKEVDLNAGVVSTLNVIRARARECQVELVEDLGSLPLVSCYPAKINQVVLNLVVNAIDACRPGERVTVSTRAA
ncbi:MAG: histidine kinase,Response regulator receiver domain proteinhistidine kinase, partial [Acidimicrobiales bacterium]|nr:histidine kinase,Response regulator receiver domain proteinhistidine kinase [Acidimicrobiales bacterium]